LRACALFQQRDLPLNAEAHFLVETNGGEIIGMGTDCCGIETVEQNLRHQRIKNAPTDTLSMTRRIDPEIGNIVAAGNKCAPAEDFPVCFRHQNAIGILMQITEEIRFQLHATLIA
jgi:uncharacterized ferredoxin-like protein